MTGQCGYSRIELKSDREIVSAAVTQNGLAIQYACYELRLDSNIKDIAVKQGQRVTTNQELGKVLSNGEGISELRFQIRKNFDALNPQDWLRN